MLVLYILLRYLKSFYRKQKLITYEKFYEAARIQKDKKCTKAEAIFK